jgi:hypothetical protein
MAIQQRASGIFAGVQSLVDKVVSPETRKQYYDKTTAFAHEQPLLFVCISSVPVHPRFQLPKFINDQELINPRHSF